MLKRFSLKTISKLMRLYPPFLGSGISVRSFNEDYTEVVVQMVQRKTNMNVIGSHYGGSLYSMCDPFYMFILLHHLGSDHIVWDKSASIDFLKPGYGTVTATFKINHEEIEKIRQQALESYKLEPKFEAVVVDAKGVEIARVHKTLYVRRKDAKKRFKQD